MNYVLRYLGAAGVLVAGGLAMTMAPQGTAPTAPAAEVTTAADAMDATLCQGGIEGEFKVELVPSQVRGSDTEERLVLSMETTNHGEADRKVMRSVRIVTPGGELAQESQRLAQGEVPVAKTTADPFELPRLADGYYRVVGQAQDGQGRTEGEVYVRVQGGRQLLVSFEDWYLKSGMSDVGGRDFAAEKGER